MKDLIYFISSSDRNVEGLTRILSAHPEIRFVSLVAVDLGGNDTDEKVPVSHFIKNINEYLSGGVQTDGSSVVLPGIATLNDGKVDLIADPEVNWFVDYNHEHNGSHAPVGTLRIPSFLKHRDRLVDSRSMLRTAMASGERRVMDLLRQNTGLTHELGIEPREIKEVKLIAATELEFWVRTPGANVATEKLSISQLLQESYWKRTKGSVRSALEESLIMLEKFDLAPEMGHKEVGGVKATIAEEGRLGDIMEQLEIDWKYAPALQAADNELLARIVIKEVFRHYGLEATFMAKPIEGVAGSGEHTHISIMAVMRNGSPRNLFAPVDMARDFLSPLGWGALMGLLRNYEVVGSFITSSNDAFNRLKPGFEAPVCIVAAIGHDVAMPSRNRTVLAGLIRDRQNPLATRFELRAPNPHTNSYLALSAIYQAMLDGMAYAAGSGKSAGKLEKDFCKAPGVEHEYLEKDRAYRSEQNVFEHYTGEERNRLFGVPPATVWETLENLDRYPAKRAVLGTDGVLPDDIVEAYRKAMLMHWVMELCDRIIPDNVKFIRSCAVLHHTDGNRLDQERWEKIRALREQLIKDDVGRNSLVTTIREAVAAGDYAEASRLQMEMTAQMSELRALYRKYRRNILLNEAPVK